MGEMFFIGISGFTMLVLWCGMALAVKQAN